jgi:hypothetical protein
MRAGVKPFGAVILVLVHTLFSRADLFEAIPKRRVMAEFKAVKVERSRARGHVASNTLTALNGAISWPPLNCFKQKFINFLQAMSTFWRKRFPSR